MNAEHIGLKAGGGYGSMACRGRCRTLALKQLPEVASKKPAKKRDEARASTTDPEARVRKMADGGFRPAYNAQLAVDTASQIVVGVDLVNQGSDQGKLITVVDLPPKTRCQAPGLDSRTFRGVAFRRVVNASCRCRNRKL